MDKVSVADFPSIAFQATLTTSSLLLVVFGVLYTVFGTYIGQDHRPIIHVLRIVCRYISVFILVDAFLTIYSLILLLAEIPANIAYIILAVLIGLTVFALAIFSMIWAFKYMSS